MNEEIERKAQELWDRRREELGLPPAPLPEGRADFRLYALGQLIAEEHGFEARPLPDWLNVR